MNRVRGECPSCDQQPAARKVAAKFCKSKSHALTMIARQFVPSVAQDNKLPCFRNKGQGISPEISEAGSIGNFVDQLSLREPDLGQGDNNRYAIGSFGETRRRELVQSY